MFLSLKVCICISVFLGLSYTISPVYAIVSLFVIALVYYDNNLEKFGVEKFVKFLLKVRSGTGTNRSVVDRQISYGIVYSTPKMNHSRLNKSTCGYSPIQSTSNGVGKNSEPRLTSTPLPSLSGGQNRNSLLYTSPKMRTTLPTRRYFSYLLIFSLFTTKIVYNK